MTGGKPFQSKLNPHLEFIRELRRKRTPYPEIARLLREKYDLEVGPTTIFDFVKVRSKKRDVYTIHDQEPAPPLPALNEPSPAIRSRKSAKKSPTIPSPSVPASPVHEIHRPEVPAAVRKANASRRAAIKPSGRGGSRG